MDLAHITLNTGDIRDQPAGEVGEDAIAYLGPIIDAGGGPVDVVPGWRVEVSIRDGGAAFSLAAGGRPVFDAMLGADPGREQALWESAMGMCRASLETDGFPMPKVMRKPARVPWLAVILRAGLASLPRGEIMAVADFERCLAFALLRRMGRMLR